MKLPQNLFPPIQLTQRQCGDYEKLADSVVARALDEYDGFNVTRQLDRTRWKKLRKCDGITIYGERSNSRDSTSSTTSSLSSPLAASNADDIGFGSEESTSSTKQRAVLPKLLGVGRVPGKLEDMIYGALAPTPTQAQIITAYVNDEIADCKTLYEIKGPTPAEPLRFLGLKWIIKSHSSAIGAVSRQRDLVFVESVGITTRRDGTRIGYFVMHSVELPQCGELTEHSIVRARTSSCYLLRQDGSSVDVFVKSSFDSVGLRSAVNSLATVALNQISGHHRKMGWEVTKRMRDPNAATTPPPSTVSTSRCSGCSKSFSRLNRTLTCVFCWSRVCSKCCEQRDLTIPNPIAKGLSAAKLVTRTSVNTCKSCYSNVFRNQSAVEVARQEVLAREYGSVPIEAPPREKRAQSVPVSRGLRQHLTPTSPSQVRVVPRAPRAFSVGGNSVSTSSMSTEDLSALVNKIALQSIKAVSEEVPVEEIGGDALTDSVIEVRRDDGEWIKEAPASPTAPRTPTAPSDDLYERIANLHQTAESLYQYTKRTTDNVLGGGGDGAPMPRR